MLYFVESRERVPVRFDDQLREQTLSAISGLRLTTAGGQLPAPLDDSTKCPRCSLVGICLPDEVTFLKRQDTPPRAIAVGLTEALPMHVQAHQAKVAKEGELLSVTVEDKPPYRVSRHLHLPGNAPGATTLTGQYLDLHDPLFAEHGPLKKAQITRGGSTPSCCP